MFYRNAVNPAKLILFGIGIAVLIASSFYSYYRVGHLNKLSERVNHTNLVKLELQKASTWLSDATSALHIFLLTKDSVYYEQMINAEAGVRQSLLTLQQQMADNATQAMRMQLLDSIVRKRNEFMREGLQPQTVQYRSNADSIALCNERIIDAMAMISAEEEKILAIREKERSDYQTITPLIILGIKLVIIAVLIVALWMLTSELRNRNRLQNDLFANNDLLQRMNKDLAKQKDFSEAILNESLSLIAVYDKNQRIISFNRECERSLGKKFEEVAGKTFLEVWPGRTDSEVYRDVQRAFKGERVHNPQYQAIAPGRYFESHTLPLFDSKNEIYCVVCIAHEITHVIQTAKTLEKMNLELTLRKEFAESLLDNSVDIICVLDKSLNFIAFNKKASEVYQMNSGMIGKSLIELYPSTKNSPTHRSLLEAFEGKSVYGLKHHSVVVEKHFESFFIPLKQSDDIYAVMMIHHDVTEIHETSAKLQDRNIELERSNAALEQFAYVASHDLREPLRKIQTFTTLAERYLNVPAKAQVYLDKINSSAARMSTLIQDVLNYSLINRTNEPHTHVDLNVVMQQVITDLELVIETKGAKILYDGLPTVHGSNQQLTQLFQNLISNSLKFTTDTPEISITCRLAMKQYFDTYDCEADYFRIDVRDNGIGFDPKFADHIFEVFKRLHSQHEFKGTGIGLAICRKIVHHHQGIIAATSEEGKGATFTIYLPVNPMKAQLSTVHEAVAPAAKSA